MTNDPRQTNTTIHAPPSRPCILPRPFASLRGSGRSIPHSPMPNAQEKLTIGTQHAKSPSSRAPAKPTSVDNLSPMTRKPPERTALISPGKKQLSVISLMRRFTRVSPPIIATGWLEKSSPGHLNPRRLAQREPRFSDSRKAD